jgi:hypothetical protein
MVAVRERDGWPDYLVERASRIPPEGCSIVPGSTPVVSFGDPLRPQVATLGINPSSGEFLGRDGQLLAGDRRRLATLASIGVRSHDEIDATRASQILDECATYFDRRPYGWFKALDGVLSPALGVSYYTGSACHLDLVQWATDPIWKGLSDIARARLLSSDRAFLTTQLRHEGYRLIVVAGRTAMSWVEKAGLVKWRVVERLEGQPATTFCLGDAPSPAFIGWSCNLQSQPGARGHMPSLARLLDRYARTSSEGPVPEQRGLPKGTHFVERSALLGALERWLETTSEKTIGDAGRFARAPWISFESSAGIVDLNADTKRSAITQMLEHVHAHPDEPWWVIANRRGSVNKVVFDRNDSHEGWYAYLRTPLSAPSVL